MKTSEQWHRDGGYYNAKLDKKLKTRAEFDKMLEKTIRANVQIADARYQQYVISWANSHKVTKKLDPNIGPA